MVSPKGNAWNTDYWLARCIEGNKTPMLLVTDYERIQFSIGLMVLKREYMTLDEIPLNKGVYVFEYYRPCESIYHFTKSIVGTNLQLQTMPMNKSSKVQYFLPYYEKKKLMDTISIISDLDGF